MAEAETLKPILAPGQSDVDPLAAILTLGVEAVEVSVTVLLVADVAVRHPLAEEIMVTYTTSPSEGVL